jgi:hypothetical protein
MQMGLPQPRVPQQGMGMTDRFAKWAGIVPAQQQPGAGLDYNPYETPVSLASTAVPSAMQPASVPSAKVPTGLIPPMENEELLGATTPSLATPTPQVPTKEALVQGAGIGEKGWAEKNLATGTDVAIGPDGRIVSNVASPFNFAEDSKLRTLGADVVTNQAATPSLANLGTSRIKLGERAAYEEGLRRTGINMGIGGLGMARGNPADERKILEEQLGREYGTKKRRQIEGKIAKIDAEEAASRQERMSDKAITRAETQRDIEQKNKLGLIEKTGEWNEKVAKARGLAAAGPKEVKEADKLEDIAFKAKQAADAAAFAMGVTEITDANGVTIPKTPVQMLEDKKRFQLAKDEYDRLSARLAGRTGVTTPGQAAKPAQQTQFKAGDIQVKDGIRYRRDDKGNWNPV